MSASPSDWLQRFAHLIAPGSSVLDAACGSGRHVRWMHSLGCRVTAVDRDAAAVEPLRAVADIIVADLEAGPWPLEGRQFDAVVVTNYLWRPRLPQLLDSVRPGGLLLYETFAAEQGRVGRPCRPDFLLQPGELLTHCSGAGWRVIAYEDGWVIGSSDTTTPRHVQRIAAIRDGGSGRHAAVALSALGPAWEGLPDRENPQGAPVPAR